jgi:hypothetical protein
VFDEDFHSYILSERTVMGSVYHKSRFLSMDIAFFGAFAPRNMPMDNAQRRTAKGRDEPDAKRLPVCPFSGCEIFWASYGYL